MITPLLVLFLLPLQICVFLIIPGTGSNTWIINTSASDHMTYDAKFFDELSSNTRDPYITSANGLPSPITGEGTISLTPTLSLSRALLVPNINCNLYLLVDYLIHLMILLLSTIYIALFRI